MNILGFLSVSHRDFLFPETGAKAAGEDPLLVGLQGPQREEEIFKKSLSAACPANRFRGYTIQGD